MVNIFDLLQQKIELFRLEQRYTRRRNRRSTFVSEAQYVDGEYIYSPTFTKCSAGGSDLEIDIKESSSSSSDESRETVATKETKTNRRTSKMGLDKMDWRKGRGEGKKPTKFNVTEVKVEQETR
jgi:hypothetical protein